ncbi:uncharacterized protein LOC119600859 isoform X1 [Lucilia sericata]|uniref:uncharacterized protein LOC119600859 isoform X1 n=1 Tax=Lucilia sericata TaxID=13632 RepID=UPI0018A83D46|nr:uncharacterized protein LOC119600859 isoform X1 [Lucilia sericata]
MVGPFMQGVLLMGIIYWYSKGLISMINDYYRGEFNRKLKDEIKGQKLDNIKTPTYDLSDMELLVNIELQKDQLINEEQQEFLVGNSDFKENTSYCYRLNAKEEFLNMLFITIYDYYRKHPVKNPICWLKENKNSSWAYYTESYNDFSLIK